MPLTDNLATPLSKELLACLCEQMALVTDPPASCCERTGSLTPWLMSQTQDECCSGLAWVRVVSIVPGFPEQETTVPIGNEVLQWSVTFELGAIRCGPYSKLVPGCDEWTYVTDRINEDAYAMRAAFCCFVNGAYRQPQPRPRKGSVIPGIWEPLEMEGGCAGGTMQLTVRGTPCVCDSQVS